MTTYTAAEIADIDAFIAELHKPAEIPAELQAKWDAEEARLEERAALGREINAEIARYYSAADRATRDDADEKLRGLYAEMDRITGA